MIITNREKHLVWSQRHMRAYLANMKLYMNLGCIYTFAACASRKCTVWPTPGPLPTASFTLKPKLFLPSAIKSRKELSISQNLSASPYILIIKNPTSGWQKLCKNVLKSAAVGQKLLSAFRSRTLVSWLLVENLRYQFMSWQELQGTY